MPSVRALIRQCATVASTPAPLRATGQVTAPGIVRATGRVTAPGIVQEIVQATAPLAEPATAAVPAVPAPARAT
jgi:hypothetical protein